jgi:hypothetical protein
MATKLYLRNTTSTVAGSLPTYPLDGVGNYFVTSTATLRALSTTIGAGQTSRAGSSLAQTGIQDGGYGYWTTDPLSGSQTVGGGTVTVNIAASESNTNMNLGENASGGAWKVYIYVWRPSTGAVVGTVVASYTSWNTTEPSAASTEKVIHGTLGSSGISAQDGDIVVVELAVAHNQGMASSYTNTIFYDGTTENTTTNTTVSNHAAFVQFTENLTFQTPVAATLDPMGAMGIFGI